MLNGSTVSVTLDPGEANILNTFELMILQFSSLKILNLGHLLTTVAA